MICLLKLDGFESHLGSGEPCFSFLVDWRRRVEKLEVLINCRKRSRGARIGDGIGSVGVEVEGVAAVICYSASIPTWTNMIAAASASDNGS